MNEFSLEPLYVIAQFVFPFAVGCYTWLVNRSKVTQEALGSLEINIQELGNRVVVCERDILHMPGKDEMKDIYFRLETTTSRLANLDGRVDTVLKINDHVIK